MEAKDDMDKNRIEFEAWYAKRHPEPVHKNPTWAHASKWDDWEVWKASRAGLAAPVEGQSGLEKLVRYHHNGYSKDMHEDPCGEFYKVEGVQAIFATLAAPVAATEQAIYQVRRKSMHGADFHWRDVPAERYYAQYDADEFNEKRVLYLATPADAGARRTPRVDALMAKWDDDGATRGSAFIELRNLARELETEVLARLSTSPAPVTAEPVATDLYKAAAKLIHALDVLSRNEDIRWPRIEKALFSLRSAMVAIERAALVSPEPAASLPATSSEAAPVGYARESELAKLTDDRVAGVGMMIHKEAGEGKVALYRADALKTSAATAGGAKL